MNDDDFKLLRGFADGETDKRTFVDVESPSRLKIRLYYPPFSQIFSLRKTFNSVVLLKFVVVWRYSPLTVNNRLFPLISIYMKQDKTELTIKYHQLHLLHTRLFYELSICKNQNQIFFFYHHNTKCAWVY